MTVREFLRKRSLLFDGSMGVYYRELYPDGTCCEEVNLTHPERIVQIHRSYIEAGASAIRTNTFASNRSSLKTDYNGVEKNLRAAWQNAVQAAEGTDVFLFADIGPLPGLIPNPEEYEFLVDTFLQMGAKNFIFETFADLNIQTALAERIKKLVPDSFIIADFAVLAEGFTTTGSLGPDLVAKADNCTFIDAAGFNCLSGPAHLQKLVERMKQKPAYLSVMPNAGYPALTRGKPVYGAKPEYFAARMAELQAGGVRILGGCCGTNPDFIRATAQAIEHPVIRLESRGEEEGSRRRNVRNRLAEKLDSGERVIAVELDPPADDAVEFLINGARRLCDRGADAITIADCPIARARADSSMLAAKLRRELDIDPIPHMTCRDRNLNATRALLLGLSIEDVHNVLVVTGDPVPTGEREHIKSVYNFNSVMLSSYIRNLGDEGMTAPFHVYAALNVNAKNFASELRKAQRKEQAGVYGFLTQPVITDQAFENLKLAHETLKGHILGGIYPIVSEKNAVFMNSEVAGISVSQEVIDRYRGLDRRQGEDMAVQFTVESAIRMKPYTSGWYITTPFKRIELMERILKELNQIR